MSSSSGSLPRPVSGDPGGGVEAEPSSEHAEPVEELPVVIVEQVVAPLNRRPQRLLADVGGRADLVQEGETVVQAGEDGGRRQHLDPGCGEFDRQREPVEHLADVGDVGGVRLVDLESRAGGASPVAEQANGLGLLDLLQRRARMGEAERRNRPGHLAGHGERLAAGGQDGECRAVPEQPAGGRRTGIHEVLARVEHEQAGPVSDPDRERLERIGVGRHTDGARNLVRDHAPRR